MEYLMKLAQIWATCVKKARKEFRKAMGKKTIKINGLQHIKLQLVKTQLTKESNQTLTLGDTIEALCDMYSKDLLNKKQYNFNDGEH